VILVLRALGVGDLATAVPALRGLRRAFPGEPLVLAAPQWLRPLVDLVEAVDGLLPVAGLRGRHRWPAARLGVNLHGRGPQSHRLLASARPGRMLAFASAAAGFADGPVWRAEEHEVHRWCRLLGWYGIAADPADLALPAPAGPGPVAPAGLTIVHPGAKEARRRWPPERFGRVAAALAAAGHRVVVTGSAPERRLAARVARCAGLPGTAVLAGRTDLGEFAALVAGARLVISGDTGIGHLATAYGIPSVLLFGPVAPGLWGPPPDRPRHRALWHGAVAGDAPGDAAYGSAPHPALLRITEAEVLAAAALALRSAGVGRAAAAK
jgi:ADP-heptose:LPS heptosyltransferase